MKILGQLTLFIFIISSISCSNEYESNKYQELIEYLNNWEHCYANRFIFPISSIIEESSYIKGTINLDSFCINDINTEFLNKVSYEFSFSTIDSMIGSENQIYSNKIHIGLIQNDDFRQIALVLPYPEDSLNNVIQNKFASKELICSSNFTGNDINFQVSTNCLPSGSVKFSTFYSDSLNQNIKIKTFSSRKIDNKWYYILEFNANKLHLSNEIYNSRSEDLNAFTNGNPNIIENIEINNLSAMIYFEIPND